VEVGIVEIFETTYACSPSVLSGALGGIRFAGAPSTWTPCGHEGGVRVLAPVTPTAQGTTPSIAMRDRITSRTQAAAVKATALLPISVSVDNDGYAGIRSWSPPV
jgi:hypothetical protein